jgi:hypothetical protein
MTRPALFLALAAVVYSAAAWAVAPGFYDGFAPPATYNWVSPPPQFAQGNKAPPSRHADIPVLPNGKVSPEMLITPDSQVQISFTTGAFVTPPGARTVGIDIKPVSSFPDPGPIHLSTNVYCVTSTSQLAPGQTMLITLVFSSGIPTPGALYEYQNGTGPWTQLKNSNSAIPFTVSGVTSNLDCFAAGYTGNPNTGPGITPTELLIGILVLVGVVVLAGIPLLLARGRESSSGS